MATAEKPTCFVIAPIGPKDSDVRKRSDKVLKHIFKKALAENFEVIRGDEIDEPGMITSQVLRAVQDSELVVADLTEHNPNVLYELAVRHAVDKPVIHVIEPHLSKIPFDVAGFRTIEFDLTDPDSIENAVEQLRKHAEQAMSGKWGETPIKLANIMRRTTGDSPELLLLKEAVDGIADVSARLATLEFAARSARASRFSDRFNRWGNAGYFSGPVTLRDLGIRRLLFREDVGEAVPVPGDVPPGHRSTDPKATAQPSGETAGDEQPNTKT